MSKHPGHEHGASASARPAATGDVPLITGLLDRYASEGLLLKRSSEEVLDKISNFTVVESNGVFAGCVAVRDFRGNLFEIRSLAVSPDLRGHRLGTFLVEKALERIPRAPGVRVFVLTYRPNLFLRAGFHEVSKELFPEKVWTDCVGCRKRERCDEIALMVEF